MYDGQVLQKLFERLKGEDLNLSDIRQAESEQKKKLKTVLERIDEYLELGVAGGTTKWSVDSIHSKNYVAILHLLGIGCLFTFLTSSEKTIFMEISEWRIQNSIMKISQFKFESSYVPRHKN